MEFQLIFLRILPGVPCDLNSNGAKVLNAEILFNIGHTSSMETFEKNVIMIDAFDDISFDKVTEKCVELLRGKTISLITDSQHLNQIELIKKTLEENGVKCKKLEKERGNLMMDKFWLRILSCN